MVRLVLTWKNSPWAFELRPGLNKLGRNPTNDFRISDPSISSFHVEIVVEEEEIRVRDLGSTNGTFINGEKLREGTLGPGMVLRLGTVELQLEEVLVTRRPEPMPQRAGEGAGGVELPKQCAYHPGTPAAYQCENCAGLLCEHCVKVVGHDRLNTMTLCPVCNGQCNHLAPKPPAPPKNASLLSRLTQTLKIPFAR